MTPARDVVLSWPTFDQAADEAGLSRRYGGIHSRQADLESGELGRRIGVQAWERARTYFGDRDASRPRVPHSNAATR